MPNWCEIDLMISLPKGADVNRFVKEISVMSEEDGEKRLRLSYNQIVRCPAELTSKSSPNREATEDEKKELIKKYGADNWYDWNCNNWGCKWDASSQSPWSIDEEKRKVAISFLSPWGPPDGYFRKLSQAYPKVKIVYSYYEGGMGFAGKVTLKGGVLVSSSHRDNYRGGRGG